METEWLLDEIATGLQKLYLLSLDRTPAAELLAGTAHAWLEAIEAGNKWQADRDAPRIRAAFVTLARTVDRWPSPRVFLDALPRVEQAAISYEVKPATREEAAARMAEIRAMLDKKAPGFRVEESAADRIRKEGGIPLSEVERDLQQHYAGKMAAAGPDA